MKINNLPNILLLSDEVPQSINAGAILLMRLLKNYPSEKLLVIGAKPDKNAESLECRYESYKPVFERMLTTRFDRVVRSLRAFKLIPGKPIYTLLNGFKPDIVLSVMQSQSYFLQAYRYAKKEGLPLVLIVHDDPEIFDKVYRFANRKKQELNKKIYAYASKRLCISPEMVQYLKLLYGADGDVLYPNPSEFIIPRPLEETRKLKNPPNLTIAYAGSLAYGYGQRLEQMLPVLGKVGAKLNIYSPSKKDWFNNKVVNYCGYSVKPEHTWERIKQECDVVILPYSFEDYPEHKLYYTHFPSKLPEYLSLQMPVIITGPPYATGVKWGINNSAAQVIPELSDDSLLIAVQELIGSAEKRFELARNAFQLKNKYFNPETIRVQFYNYINECIP